MDYAALAAALAAPDLAALSHADAAAALSAQTVPMVRDVPTSEARAVLLATGEWGGIVLAARSDPSEQRPVALIEVCITVVDTLRETETLEMTKPAYWASVQQMLGALRQAALISEATHAALLALRDVALPVWGVVTAHDVAAARSR
jgi:hypothetical protein